MISDFKEENIRYQDIVTLMRLDNTIWRSTEVLLPTKVENEGHVKLKGKITGDKLR